MTDQLLEEQNSISKNQKGPQDQMGNLIPLTSMDESTSVEFLKEHGGPWERRAREIDERYKDLVDDKAGRITNWMLKSWNVPLLYCEKKLDNFHDNNGIVNVCRSSVKNGDILFTGSTGCGKTHLAVAMLREIALLKIQPLREPGERPFDNEPLRARFVTVPQLFMNLRASFQDSRRFVSEKDIIDQYSHCQLLILDDLGAEKVTEFTLSSLYLIIDNRINYRRRTIVTTNLSLQEIEEKMDARLASRLSGMKIIKINMPDYRKKRD